MAGRIINMEEISTREFANLDRSKTAVFLAISPLEGHGFHLPLGVDFFNARYFAENVANIAVTRKPEFDAIIFPALPLGTQLYNQAGSIKIKNSTLNSLIYEIGKSFAEWDFKYIYVLSGHGSPVDIVSIEDACHRISKKFKIQMHNLSGAMALRFLKGEFIDQISHEMSTPLSNEDKNKLKNDIHGGWWETSMMIFKKPELVGNEYKSLPDNFRENNTVDSNAGYYGSPSKATAEFAEKSIKVMSSAIGDILYKSLSGKNITAETTSDYFNKKSMRPNFGRKIIAISLISVKFLVICWLIYKYFIR